MVEYFIGTSGWMYDWNPDGFEWYVKNSSLNAVELNVSFYRFPFSSQVLGWLRRTPDGFMWAVKVNRWITHRFRLNERALGTWSKFYELFKPLRHRIRFYLFQLPPSFIPNDRSILFFAAILSLIALVPTPD